MVTWQMEKSSYFLFGGTNFNKKKFAPDFAKFKVSSAADVLFKSALLTPTLCSYIKNVSLMC